MPLLDTADIKERDAGIEPGMLYVMLCNLKEYLKGNSPVEWQDSKTKHAWPYVAMVTFYCLQRMKAIYWTNEFCFNYFM